MAALSVVEGASVLIRNGLIEQTGPSRRIDNLAPARAAVEIDVQGAVVIPAPVDGSCRLIASPHPGDAGKSLRTISAANLLQRALPVGSAIAASGWLTAGASTPPSTDRRTTFKTLRVQKELRNRPLRIRSIVSHTANIPAAEFASGWLSPIRKSRLAAIVELNFDELPEAGLARMSEVAAAAASAGFAIRLTSDSPLAEQMADFALQAGALALTAPVTHASIGPKCNSLSLINCVCAIPAVNSSAPGSVRAMIDAGQSVALTTGRTSAIPRSAPDLQSVIRSATGPLGMSAEETIVALTHNAACALRLSHLCGSLDPGKAADLLVIDSNDYREMPRTFRQRDMRMVIRSGQILPMAAGAQAG